LKDSWIELDPDIFTCYTTLNYEIHTVLYDLFWLAFLQTSGIHMNLLRFSPLDNLHLYNSNIVVQFEYLILDETQNNAHPKNINTVFLFLKIICLDHISTYITIIYHTSYSPINLRFNINIYIFIIFLLHST